MTSRLGLFSGKLRIPVRIDYKRSAGRDIPERCEGGGDEVGLATVDPQRHQPALPVQRGEQYRVVAVPGGREGGPALQQRLPPPSPHSAACSPVSVPTLYTASPALLSESEADPGGGEAGLVDAVQPGHRLPAGGHGLESEEADPALLQCLHPGQVPGGQLGLAHRARPDQVTALPARDKIIDYIYLLRYAAS